MVEIISLHILKTGGTSFLEILQDQYTKRGVYHYIEKPSRFKDIRRKLLLSRMSSRTRVVHGHFVYRNIEHLVARHQPKLITWFRNPVDRVISRYYFLMKHLERNPRHPKRHLRHHSLLEFARLESQMNVQCKFVQGFDLSRFFFFGFLETFDDDIRVLASKLDWRQPNIYHRKDNAQFKNRYANDVTEQTRREISAINSSDVELYDRAWSMKREAT